MTIKIAENSEDSILIKRKKISVAKKYSPTRSRSIEEANELAVYLFAMDRLDEALTMLKSYSEKSPYMNSKYERWEASCFAMLLQSHIERLQGNSTEHKRLLSIINNELFSPSNWVKSISFDEFISSTEAGADHIDGASKGEKLKARAEGLMILINAYYCWCKKWDHFFGRDSEIQETIMGELHKIREVVA